MSSPHSPDAHPVIHGLRIQAPDLQLAGCPATRRATSTVSVSIRVLASNTARAASEAAVSFDPTGKPGNTIAELSFGDDISYVILEHNDALTFFFPGLCSGHFKRESHHLKLETIAQHWETTRLLVPNTLLSAVLGAAGHVVLHASAVQVSGKTVAICGPSRSGKSSLAALALQHGAAIVSDDALRVYTAELAGVWCYPGAPELRLRATRAWPNLNPLQLRPLPDGRTGYLCPRVVNDESQLYALVFPIPTTGKAPILKHIKGLHAIGRSLSASRIAWTATTGACMLPRLSKLVGKISVYELSVPWHRFSEPDTHQALADCLFQAALG